jgi:glycosyltransferase involved in cell wall biosynthesis
MASARVIAISQSTAADLEAHGVPVRGVVTPGSDMPALEKARNLTMPPRIIFLGRLVRSKRPLEALAAFRTIREAFPEATLDIVGGGYLERDLVRDAEEGVTVHGQVTACAKEALLSRSHLMLLPGTREGWGIVAIEAARRGVPVVAYQVPGLCEAVLGDTTGLLVDCEPEALGSAAVELLRDSSRWATVSAAAVEESRWRSWERSASELMAVIAPGDRVPARGDAA